MIAHAHVDGRWQLGHGYSAVVYEQGRIPGSTEAHRSFEILHDGRVVIRLRRFDDQMRVTPRDFTGHGVKEVLVLDYTDGSGGCGTWRLYGGRRLRELWVQWGCADWKRVRLEADGLHAWDAIGTSKTKASGTYIHCCWSRWRETRWGWSGTFVRTRVTVVTNPPQPQY